jgi:hypothetical protein
MPIKATFILSLGLESFPKRVPVGRMFNAEILPEAARKFLREVLCEVIGMSLRDRSLLNKELLKGHGFPGD